MGFLSSTPATATNTTTTTSSSSLGIAAAALPIDDADAAAGQHLLQQQQQQQHQRSSSGGNGIAMSSMASSALSSFTSSEHVALLDKSNNNKDGSCNISEAMHLIAPAPAVPYYYETPPMSANSITSSVSSMRSMSSNNTTLSLNGKPENHPSDLEWFEDLVSEPVLVLGVDISHLSRQGQFIVCAMGLFGFSLLYGYLQELISVQLCNRQLGLFLAMMQFSGYTLLAYILRNFVYSRQQKSPYFINKRVTLAKQKQQQQQQSQSQSQPLLLPSFDNTSTTSSQNSKYKIDHSHSDSLLQVPLYLYLGLSLLRAIDLAMTNMAMQYINYPAKTLMKSSRVVFTMLFGVVIARKSYQVTDYVIVMTMVFGLVLFMHADANSSAVFDISGVAMLTVSLLCDGAISNMSESIMTTFGVGQDEFIFRMYSIALVAITFAAAAKGDLREGLLWMSQPGTYNELTSGALHPTWSVGGKIAIMVLFSSMGFFGSSCSAAITKNFGALTMSLTSTTRKATTLFLSFFLFNNVCTWEHLLGVAIFIAALTAKSLRRRKHHSKSSSSSTKKKKKKSRTAGTKHINEQWNLTMEQHFNNNNNNNNKNVSAPSTMESMAMASGLATTTTTNNNNNNNNEEAQQPLDVVLDDTPGRSSSGVTQRRAHQSPARLAHVV